MLKGAELPRAVPGSVVRLRFSGKVDKTITAALMEDMKAPLPGGVELRVTPDSLVGKHIYNKSVDGQKISLGPDNQLEILSIQID